MYDVGINLHSHADKIKFYKRIGVSQQVSFFPWNLDMAYYFENVGQMLWPKCFNLLTLDGDKLSAGNLRMLNPKLYRSCDDLLNMLLIEDTNMVPTL